jgi:branched-chain amino acid transport system permease protein
MSVGLSLIWGSVGILNFSHGALFMIGAYIAWTAIFVLGLNWGAALVVAIVLTFVVGIFLDRLCVRPLLPKPNYLVTIIVATLGFSLVSEAVVTLAYGGMPKKVPPPIEGLIPVGSLVITYESLVVLMVSLVTLVAALLFLAKTKQGMAMRAVSQDLDASKLMGINVYRVYSYTMGVAAVLAAVAGILLSSVYFTEPHVGFIPMMKAFAVIVLGGLGSIKGTTYAAFLTGLIEALAGTFFGIMWCLPVLFFAMIVILTFRPQGLFGAREAAV